MYKRRTFLIIVIASYSFFAFCFIGKVNAAVVADDLIAEINSSGEISRGKPLEADKPVFRPVYQGDYKTIFNDAIGPQGKFTGYYDPKNNMDTYKYLQKFDKDDNMILKNIGSYQGRKVALKFTFLFRNGFSRIGIEKDGSILLQQLTEYTPFTYQLVYDTPEYPVVKDIYLDLPSVISVSPKNENINSVSRITVGLNLKKYYLILEDEWLDRMSRKYSIIDDKFLFEPSFKDLENPNGTLPFSNSIVTDNNQPTRLQIQSAMNYISTISLFKSIQKTAYVPNYLPVRVNGEGNSTKFEANYDVGQTVSDTYDSFFPETLKIIVEDKEGYFKKIDQKNLVFKDKDGVDITKLVTIKQISNSKLEFSISKASLKILQSNQVNVQLTFNDLILDKVLSNFDSEKKVYNIPLTFYNIRNKDGVDKQSEETKVNATINPNIYGEAKSKEVLVGTSTKDLNPLDLIENGVTTIPGDTLKARFIDDKEFTTAGAYNVSVELASTVTPELTKVVTVPVTAKKGMPITSAFFENQLWIINEINRQLSPKKIDADVYEADLKNITQIDLTTGLTYPTEHIPTTIGKLTNLNYLRIANRKLIGSLPTELGELSKLTTLSIYGNTFEGGIPSAIEKLTKLDLIALDDNNLKGTIPASLGLLPNLKQIYLNKNQLSGQLPEFQNNMKLFYISDTQVTYNLKTVPSFITSAASNSYENTFISDLKLTGNSRVSSKGAEIKPFNENDTGYFNLKALQGKTSIELFDEHSYTIKDTADGKIYYTGKRDSQVTIPYKKGISYTVILDDAEKNPNNVFLIQGKVDEFKFETTPASLSIHSKLGVKAQPVVLNGNLAIFDNRENKNWKLSITPSKLVVGLQSLKGEYSYTNKNGVSNSIVTGKKFMIETGKSDSVNEVIPVSEEWNATRGLSYTAYQSNYTGEYKGTVNWTLEDTP